jgi:hypothetical protein
MLTRAEKERGVDGGREVMPRARRKDTTPRAARKLVGVSEICLTLHSRRGIVWNVQCECCCSALSAGYVFPSISLVCPFAWTCFVSAFSDVVNRKQTHVFSGEIRVLEERCYCVAHGDEWLFRDAICDVEHQNGFGWSLLSW